jgi:hypothetical protein
MRYTTQFERELGKEQFGWRVVDGKATLIGYNVAADGLSGDGRKN